MRRSDQDYRGQVAVLFTLEKKQTKWARMVVDDRIDARESVCEECARKSAKGKTKRWTD